MRGIECTTYQSRAVAQILHQFDIPFIPQNPNLTPVYSLSAPTGSGKTVMAIHLVEELIRGESAHNTPHPDLRVLWVSQSPELNEQTRQKFLTFCEETGPDDLYIIDDDTFFEDEFPAGKIGFINTQKLSRVGLLGQYSDNRENTFWDVFNATVERHFDDFLVIIDEAHQGAREIRDSELTRLQQLIQPNTEGSPVTRPAKTLGLSATSRRFRHLVSRTNRHLERVNVSARDVRETGILKDRILTTLDGDITTLLSGALERYDIVTRTWSDYCDENPDEATVSPLLCIQVRDRLEGEEETLTASPIEAIVDTLVDHGIDMAQVRHAFGEHQPIDVSGVTIDYIPPSSIQSSGVHVVLFKQSIVTGWDCPRAELLISDRSSDDYTVVSQLIGRVLRSPLHRRIENRPELNDVHLYLPHFNQDTVQTVLANLRGTGDEDDGRGPATMVVQLPLDINYVEEHVRLNELTTYHLNRAPVSMPAILRLNRVINRLGLEDLVEVADIHQQILDSILSIHSNRIEEGHIPYCGGTIEYSRFEVDTLEGEFIIAEPEQLHPSESAFITVHSANSRILPESICTMLNAQLGGESNHNIIELSSLLETILAEEYTFADLMLEKLIETHESSLSTLSESARIELERFMLLDAEPRPTNLVVGQTALVALGDTEMPRHLFSNGGISRPDISAYEREYLDMYTARCSDPEKTGWYRNPINQESGLRIPYRESDFENPYSEGTRVGKYPDMLFFRRENDKLIVDILEPHGQHLEDWMYAAHGFAHFAELHGDEYGHIVLATKPENDRNGDFFEFDFNDQTVREALRNASCKDDFINTAPTLRFVPDST